MWNLILFLFPRKYKTWKSQFKWAKQNHISLNKQLGFVLLSLKRKPNKKEKKKSIKLQFLMHTHNLLSPKDSKKHIQFQFQTRINEMKQKQKDWKIGSEPRLTACVRTCRIWRDLMESTVSPIQPIITVSLSLSLSESLKVTEIKANPRFILLLMFGCASYNAGELLFL